MAPCNLCETCFFFNDAFVDNLAGDAEYLRIKYCKEDFTKCTIWQLAQSCGIGRVPGYVYPNDMVENLKFNLFEPHGGLDMFIKVIYPDGTLGKVRVPSVAGLIKAGKIIAFLCSEGWVEVRRKSKSKYNGEDRRKTVPERFMQDFNSDKSAG